MAQGWEAEGEEESSVCVVYICVVLSISNLQQV